MVTSTTPTVYHGPKTESENVPNKFLPLPFIYCPPAVVKDLPPDSARVYVRIPQPKTNMNWYVYIYRTFIYFLK